jgi:hypothetical protein
MDRAYDIYILVNCKNIFSHLVAIGYGAVSNSIGSTTNIKTYEKECTLYKKGRWLLT